LHYFKPTKKNPEGRCQHCKADLVDWRRLHQRDIGDVNHTIAALHLERIRHLFWTTAFDSDAICRAKKRGLDGLRDAAQQRVGSKSIAGVPGIWDGRQTSKTGNVVNYAQHAMACCCRKCIEYWHGIPRDRELTEAEVAYLVELIMVYLQQRAPDFLASEPDYAEPEVRHG
jgi:hypothetical protein